MLLPQKLIHVKHHTITPLLLQTNLSLTCSRDTALCVARRAYKTYIRKLGTAMNSIQFNSHFSESLRLSTNKQTNKQTNNQTNKTQPLIATKAWRSLLVKLPRSLNGVWSGRKWGRGKRLWRLRRLCLWWSRRERRWHGAVKWWSWCSGSKGRRQGVGGRLSWKRRGAV